MFVSDALVASRRMVGRNVQADVEVTYERRLRKSGSDDQ